MFGRLQHARIADPFCRPAFSRAAALLARKKMNDPFKPLLDPRPERLGDTDTAAERRILLAVSADDHSKTPNKAPTVP